MLAGRACGGERQRARHLRGDVAFTNDDLRADGRAGRARTRSTCARTSSSSTPTARCRSRSRSARARSTTSRCLHRDEVARLAAVETAAVLLPGAEFLGGEQIPPARALVDAGAICVLATDLNPGTSPVLSIPVVIGLRSVPGRRSRRRRRARAPGRAPRRRGTRRPGAARRRSRSPRAGRGPRGAGTRGGRPSARRRRARPAPSGSPRTARRARGAAARAGGDPRRGARGARWRTRRSRRRCRARRRRPRPRGRSTSSIHASAVQPSGTAWANRPVDRHRLRDLLAERAAEADGAALGVVGQAVAGLALERRRAGREHLAGDRPRLGEDRLVRAARERPRRRRDPAAAARDLLVRARR